MLSMSPVDFFFVHFYLSLFILRILFSRLSLRRISSKHISFCLMTVLKRKHRTAASMFQWISHRLVTFFEANVLSEHFTTQRAVTSFLLLCLAHSFRCLGNTQQTCTNTIEQLSVATIS